jgi:hypothetical protein
MSEHVHGFHCAETDDHATEHPWPGWVGLRVGEDHGKHAGKDREASEE